MEREEVVDRIKQLRDSKYITDDDVTTLTKELDEAFGDIINM